VFTTPPSASASSSTRVRLQPLTYGLDYRIPGGPVARLDALALLHAMQYGYAIWKYSVTPGTFSEVRICVRARRERCARRVTQACHTLYMSPTANEAHLSTGHSRDRGGHRIRAARDRGETSVSRLNARVTRRPRDFHAPHAAIMRI